MEIFAIVLWLLIVGAALPLGGLGALVSAGLGIQAFAALGGLTGAVLYAIFPDDEWLAWAACGMGVLGVLAVAVGAARLTSDDRPVSPAGQSGEEVAALLAGVAGPLFAVTAVITGAAALTAPSIV